MRVKEAVARTIEENARIILGALANRPPDETKVTGPTEHDLSKLTKLNLTEINDAAASLRKSGLADSIKISGPAPYDFRRFHITSRGRYEYERLILQGVPEIAISETIRPPAPIGSPFGFTAEDWKIVAER